MKYKKLCSMWRFQGYEEGIISQSVKSFKGKQNKSKAVPSPRPTLSCSEQGEEKVQLAGNKRRSWKKARRINRKLFWKTKGQFWKTIGHFCETERHFWKTKGKFQETKGHFWNIKRQF